MSAPWPGTGPGREPPVGAFLLTLTSSLLTWTVIVLLFGRIEAWLVKATVLGVFIGGVQAWKVSRAEQGRPVPQNTRLGLFLLGAGLALFALVPRDLAGAALS